MYTYLHTVVLAHAPLSCSQFRTLASCEISSLQVHAVDTLTPALLPSHISSSLRHAANESFYSLWHLTCMPWQVCLCSDPIVQRAVVGYKALIAFGT